MSLTCFQPKIRTMHRDLPHNMRTKKCFLSRMKNHSAEIELYFYLKKIKIMLKI